MYAVMYIDIADIGWFFIDISVIRLIVLILGNWKNDSFELHAFFVSSIFISNTRLKLTKYQANAK